MNLLTNLIQQKWFQLVACLLAGITVGALFYPQTRTEERVREEMKQEYTLKEEELSKKHSLETQELQEKLTTEENSHKEFESQTTHKIESLTTENTQLKQSSRKSKFKLIKPDGTIVEKEFEESNSESSQTVVTQIREEFDQKVKSIEDKWKKIHEERVSKMQAEFAEELKKAKAETNTVTVVKESEKITETNKKKFRPEIGITTNKDIYGHVSYTIWGPMFLGGGVSGSTHGFGDARLGVGVEF